ncbi:MAG TPA: hypothetical protein DCK76_10650 [Desulfotomaculum sp.]|nr:hypothetical protein [Desulfotomaculum sp.]HBY03347.1 hypothetical protein [Desulfotomaculum sp.]
MFNLLALLPPMACLLYPFLGLGVFNFCLECFHANPHMPEIFFTMRCLGGLFLLLLLELYDCSVKL